MATAAAEIFDSLFGLGIGGSFKLKTMTDDAELLRQYVETHSEAAFAELVQRHLSLVYSAALRQVGGDTHLAQDIAQTVFSALARKAASLSNRPTLAGWLYLGAHHAAAQVVRGEQRRRVREQEAHTMHELFSDAESATNWDRVRPVLADAMRELSDADRDAVLLRYFERRPFAAIGDALELGEDAARMRVDRALDKLRVLLSRRGITSTTAALAAALGNQAMVAAPVGLAASITGTALAGAAVTATTAATATTLTAGIFMTKTTLIVTAAAIVAIVSTVYFYTKAERADAIVTTVVRERDDLREKISAAEQRVTRAEQQNAALKRDFDGIFSKQTSSAAIASNGLTEADKAKFYVRAGPGDKAEAQRQQRESRILNLEANYQALFRQLGFTAEQIERFKAVRLEGMDKSSDLFRARAAAAKAADPTIGRPGLQKVFDQANADNYAETQAALRATFGEEIAQKIQHYESALPVRPMANQLASSLFYSDAPLTPDQAERLVDIMANHSRTGPGKVDAGAMNAVAVLEEAQAVLSPTQMAAFRHLVRQRVQKQLEEERLIDRANESKGPAATVK